MLGAQEMQVAGMIVGVRLNMPYKDKEKQREYFRKHDAERYAARRQHMQEKSREWLSSEKGKEYLMHRLSGHMLPDGERKRDFLGFCELCGKPIVDGKKKAYHHWDDELPAMGIWVCYLCHKTAEGIDSGVVDKYSQIKAIIEKEYAIHCLSKAGMSYIIK